MRVESPDLAEDAAWTGRSRAAAGPGAHEPVFTIGQLSGAFGVSPRTLRFYESRGFLAPRRADGARLFNRSDRDRIAFILKAKRLGFTLREIATLIKESDGAADRQSLHLTRRQCTEQINHLERQKRDIESALAELRREYSSHYLRALGRGDTADA